MTANSDWIFSSRKALEPETEQDERFLRKHILCFSFDADRDFCRHVHYSIHFSHSDRSAVVGMMLFSYYFSVFPCSALDILRFSIIIITEITFKITQYTKEIMSGLPSKTRFVTETLADAIRSGKFKPGEKLPSLRNLGQQYGVSTMVMHQAACRLEEMGLLLRGPRSGLFIPGNSRRSELCGFITSVRMGLMENYYESFMKVCSDSDCIAMTIPEGLSGIEDMLAKQPVRVYIDIGSKEMSLNEILRCTQGYETIFCNRFEYPCALPESGVLSDWDWITEMTLRHLLNAGHRRILFVSHDPEIREYKRLEMEKAAAKVGLEFDSPEFQWCSWRDFQDNPARLVRIYRKDPPTAVFARGDHPLFEFTRHAEMFFPDAPRPEKIGAFNSLWSNQPGKEFSSWKWDWTAFWKKVFAHKGDGVEYYQPELLIKHNTGERK